MKKKLFQLLLLFVSGFLSSYAFAPTYYLAILFISFPTLLFFAFRAKSYKDAFFIGWIFGVGYFLNGIYWMYGGLAITGFKWVIPIFLLLAPSIAALYIGLCTAILHKFKSNSTICFTISFICLWVLIEIIRARILTGFPWLILGYSLAPYTAITQSASIGGVFLVSFIFLCVISTPFLIFNSIYNHENSIKSIATSALFILIFASNYMYGKHRLDLANVTYGDHKIIIIQPNINQNIKWSKEYQRQNLLKLMNLTSMAKLRQNEKAYIIWPESATSVYEMNNKHFRDYIKQVIPMNSLLLTGGVRYNDEYTKVWNSVFVLDHKGDIVTHYDKKHLVPFAEYIPFKNFLPFNINKLTYGAIDFSPGESSDAIKINSNLPSFRLLICYESFFAQDLFQNEESDPPDVYINFTNDAWFGDSPGPYQHLDITIFRSIEFGVPVARAANSGISMISDQYGRIIDRAPLNNSGLIEKNLPNRLEKKTFYSRMGEFFVIGLLLASLSCTFIIVQGMRIKKFFN